MNDQIRAQVEVVARSNDQLSKDIDVLTRNMIEVSSISDHIFLFPMSADSQRHP
jgi:hypothetical protein